MFAQCLPEYNANTIAKRYLFLDELIMAISHSVKYIKIYTSALTAHFILQSRKRYVSGYFTIWLMLIAGEKPREQSNLNDNITGYRYFSRKSSAAHLQLLTVVIQSRWKKSTQCFQHCIFIIRETSDVRNGEPITINQHFYSVV